MWFSTLLVSVSVSVLISNFLCLDEWPPFRKALLTWLTVYSLCILTICNFGCFPFWFRGPGVVLLAPVPGHCLHLTFQTDILNSLIFGPNLDFYQSLDRRQC